MKKISNYEDFILESIINETILYYSPEFREVITSIYNDNNSSDGDTKMKDIAYKLYDAERKDLDADITFVDKSPKVGYLTHSRLSQLKKLSDDDSDFNPEVIVSKEYIDKLWRNDLSGSGKGYFTNKQRGEIKISKLVNKILENDPQFTEGEKEKFVNLVKAKFSEEINFKIVSGDEIAHYYKSSNYAKETGTLGNSCMRRKSAQVFDIYTKNPEKCSLLVMLDTNEKVLGRALLWNIDTCTLEGVTKFMDRIYTANDYDLYKFQKWAKENGYAFKRKNTYTDLDGIIFNEESHTVEMTVKLNKIQYYNFPYLDTFRLYDPSGFTLYNLNVGDDDSDYAGYYILSSTDGSYTEIESGHYSEWHGGTIPEEEAVYSDYLSDYLRRDDSVEVTGGSRSYRGWYPSDYDDICYCDIDNEYYHVNDCVYSDYHDTYLLEDESTNVIFEVMPDGDVSNDDTYVHDNDRGRKWISFSSISNLLWYKKITGYWDRWDDFSGIIIDGNLIKDYKDKWILQGFEVDTFKVVGSEDEWYDEIDALALGKQINKNEERKECLFEYIERIETDEVLEAIDRKIKELENLINNQTVINFGDGEKEKYLENLEKQRKELLDSKEYIEEMVERYWE